jgi:hypothetical protein
MPVNYIFIKNIGIKCLALFKHNKILTIAIYIINVGLNYRSGLLYYIFFIVYINLRWGLLNEMRRSFKEVPLFYYIYFIY